MTALQRAEAFTEPVSFQSVALHRTLWQKQQQIVQAAATRRSSAVKGCHASGKTYAASGAVLHHLAVYPKGKVANISPTLRQVRLFWEEVEVARQKCAIAFPECSTTGLRITQERYGVGFSSSRGVNAQGLHGQDVLIITDESPGIQADIWDAIEGIRAGGRVRILKLGNPTVPSGPFFDDFGRHRATTETITISAFDTPNLHNATTGRPFTIKELQELSPEELEVSPVPYLVSRWWVLDKYIRWGPQNPRYVSRVLGEFPSQSEYAVFSLEWIEAAKREPDDKELERTKGCVIQVGIDVAGPGDDETAACARVNGIVIDQMAWPDKDPRHKVAQWLVQLKLKSGYQLGPIVVDTVGVGYYFALHLASQSEGFDVRGFVAQGIPLDQEKFVNAKAEAYFRLRDMYQEHYVCHLEGKTDEETEAQLSGVLYKETSRGLIEIESKDDARKRGVASPDRAEAEIMAFCRVVPRQQRIHIAGEYQISPV